MTDEIKEATQWKVSPNKEAIIRIYGSLPPENPKATDEVHPYHLGGYSDLYKTVNNFRPRSNIPKTYAQLDNAVKALLDAYASEKESTVKSRIARKLSKSQRKQGAEKLIKTNKHNTSLGDALKRALGEEVYLTVMTTVQESKQKQKHMVQLTVIDHKSPLVSQRKLEKALRVGVTAVDRKSAIAVAIKHAQKKGLKVTDHHYVGVSPENVIEMDEGLQRRGKKSTGSGYKQWSPAKPVLAIMKNRKCVNCKKGTYEYQTPQDQWSGNLNCTKCRHNVEYEVELEKKGNKSTFKDRGGYTHQFKEEVR